MNTLFEGFQYLSVTAQPNALNALIVKIHVPKTWKTVRNLQIMNANV